MKKNNICDNISIQAILVKYFVNTCDIFYCNTDFTTKCKQNK